MKTKSFFSKSMQSMIEQGIFSIASFVTGVLLARVAGEEASGIYSLILSAAIITIGLQRTSVVLPFNVLYPKISNDDEKQSYKSTIWSIEVIVLIVLIFAIIVLNAFGILKIQVSAVTLCVFFAGFLLRDFSRQYCYAINKITRCLCMGLTQSLLQISVLYCMYRLHRFTLNNMLLAIGIIGIIFSVLFCSDTIRFSFSSSKILESVRKNFFIAKWSVGISLSDAIKGQINLWMLNGFVSTAAVGVYNVNNTFSMLPQPVFNGLSQFLLPHFSEMYEKKKLKEMKKRIVMSISMVVICNSAWAIVLLFWGKQLIGILYGEKYIVSAMTLILCSIRGIFNSLSSIGGAILQAMEKPNIIVRCLSISVIVMCVIGVPLTINFEIIGICIAMLVMESVNASLQLLYINKKSIS